ncbi:MAG: hypothetical protein II008_10155 [Oscillospiraceae bacterium]|nr:hypothetical protein [Oscillospiraceae bacterium]
MRKLFALLLVLLLIGGIAIAETVDYTSMTDEDIYQLIDSAKAEIERRGLIGNAENATVFDEQGVTIVITSFEINTDHWMYKPALVVRVTAVNTSNKDMSICVDNAAINGWEVDQEGMIDLAAGHREKAKFVFNLEDAEVTIADELETLEIKFYYYTPESRDVVYTDPVTVTFQ